MKASGYMKDIRGLLLDGRTLSVADFVAAWPGVSMPTIYSRIRSLVRDGKLCCVGKGLYRAVSKPAYEVIISGKMHQVNDWLIAKCEGMNHCIYERNGNLYVEVSRDDIPKAASCLKEMSEKVILMKDAKAFPAVLEGYIIVGPMVSDSPVMEEGDVRVPSIEKTLVDRLVDTSENEITRQFAFQKAMEVYSVNLNRMKRYAARRGVKKELNAGLAALDSNRLELFSATQKYLADIPVIRAWVFGSFARGEETPDSDLDLLVDYDYSSDLSLLDIIGYKLALEKIIGREVDLVENCYLRPFAAASAERDKYLIYER